MTVATVLMSLAMTGLYGLAGAPIGAYAATSPFAGGNGTSTSPYEIDTPTQLEAMATCVNTGGAAYADADYALCNNIDLRNVPFTPIGTHSQYFEGTFDGNGHAICNLMLPLTLYGGPNLTDNGVKMVPSTSQYGENATDSHSREGTRRILSTECALSLGWISSRQFVKPRCRSMSAKMRATSPSSITSRLRAAASNKTCVQTWLTTRGRPRLAAKTRLSALSANTGRSV
jgi:hypothetical protein